ncbi:CoA-acylating propionaldehyde dehydrogenase [hydrothermal vent metagenome]|uniref:CoA-acylating propionaldehyde dehydrogenase n=1 Tax=hydrothermal vent metagenome TaxID=652676 RepID=A0A3B1C8E4_9ZZZZ
MKLGKDQIADIVTRVAARLEAGKDDCEERGMGDDAGKASLAPDDGIGLYDTLEEAVAAAKASFVSLGAMSLEARKRIIDSMRAVIRAQIRPLSEMAVSETGYGRVEDKVIKNTLAVDKTPGTEILNPQAFTGDNGIAIMERAPYGVIGSIAPVTNPVATVISNAIGMIAGGNAVVFNAHPAAKGITGRVISLFNSAIIKAGGPANLITAVRVPTIQTAQELMKHPDIRLLCVTGGPAVVKVAMNSGKKAICAGPGNPPVVVDETANIDDAARHIVAGASFDNNIVCVVEKEVICVDSVAGSLKEAMKKHGAFELNQMRIRKLEKLVIERAPSEPGDHGVINKKWVGQDAAKILRAIGVETDEDVKLIILDVPKEHPLVKMEQLMPVLPIARVKNVDEAIDFALEVERGFGHTAVMHSTNIDNLSKMARVINTSIFIKNGPAVAGLGFGGEGYTSFTIASPTGEGLTTALNFTRERRCTLKDRFRII